MPGARSDADGRWLFAAGMSFILYFLTVLRDEDLVRIYGAQYADYAAAVPRFGSSLLSNPFAAEQ